MTGHSPVAMTLLLYNAPSNVKMPLYVKRYLDVEEKSTLNVKNDALCNNIILNLNKLGSLNVYNISD